MCRKPVQCEGTPCIFVKEEAGRPDVCHYAGGDGCNVKETRSQDGELIAVRFDFSGKHQVGKMTVAPFSGDNDAPIVEVDIPARTELSEYD